jgi:hypothetical protein
MSDQDKQDARIFYADSRFERLARRPGGVPREQALTQAQEQVEDLKQDFDPWLDLELLSLREAVAQVHRNPADPATLERAERLCAQVQDISGTMGYELVTFVASSFCTVIDALKAGAVYDKEIVDCHMNALLLVRTRTFRNLRPDQVPEMSGGLQRVVELAKKYGAPR